MHKKCEKVNKILKIVPIFRKKPPFPPIYGILGEIWAKNVQKRGVFGHFGVFLAIFSKHFNIFEQHFHKIRKHFNKTPLRSNFSSILWWNCYKLHEFVMILLVFVRFCAIFIEFTSSLRGFPPYLGFDVSFNAICTRIDGIYRWMRWNMC